MKVFSTLLAISAAVAGVAASSPYHLQGVKARNPQIVNPCRDINCIGTHTCQPAPDGSSATCVPVDEQKCLDNTCTHGEYCCNPFLGICIEPGQACPRKREVEARVPQVANPCDTIHCIGTHTCQPTPDGSSATCVPVEDQRCGDITCVHGEYCCNSLLSICLQPGQPCPRTPTDDKNKRQPPAASAAPITSADVDKNGTFCGPNICPFDKGCCNSSCGHCGPGCTKEFCAPGPGPTCGTKGDVCPFGWVCCNESCGICTPPDGLCTTEFCT